MRNSEARFLSCLYVLSLTLLVLYAAHGLRNAVTVSAETVPQRTVILDAGHGGPDGGASTSDGVKESDINLAVALKTDAVLGLLGCKTVLTRTSDRDLSEDGAVSISQKKISDIRNRVNMVNATGQGILISIHQNTFPGESCRGAQVFYGNVGNSQNLAEQLQLAFHEQLDSGGNRTAKPISADVYLMNHIETPGVLVECGFLSNPEEAALLQKQDYQKRIAALIAVTVENYLSEEDTDV